jgi:hypothetical protein
VNHVNNQHANENLRIQNLWDGVEILRIIHESTVRAPSNDGSAESAGGYGSGRVVSISTCARSCANLQGCRDIFEAPVPMAWKGRRAVADRRDVIG